MPSSAEPRGRTNGEFPRWGVGVVVLVIIIALRGESQSGPADASGPGAPGSAAEMALVLKCDLAKNLDGSPEAVKRLSRDCTDFFAQGERTPEKRAALIVLQARVDEAAGSLAEALRKLRIAAEIAPDAGFVRRELGRALLLGGEIGAAREHLELAVQEDPSDPFAARYMGDASAGAEADTWYALSLELDPSQRAEIYSAADSAAAPSGARTAGRILLRRFLRGL